METPLALDKSLKVMSARLRISRKTEKSNIGKAISSSSKTSDMGGSLDVYIFL